MDAATGRFASTDPAIGSASKPASLHQYTYADASPVDFLDPSGQETLAEESAAIDMQASLANQAFADLGRQAGGSAVRKLGQMTEQAVEKLIRQCLKPGAKLTRNTAKLKIPGGGNAVPDFFIEMGKSIKVIEVKYKLGTTTGPAFLRAAGQIKAAMQKSDTLLVSFKRFGKRKEAEMRRLVEGVKSSKGSLAMASGFMQMAGFLSEFLIDGCLQ